mmetsp:Transcript_83194/g.258352  ORF Transcript_83194/g.258352 Transcript_83194/m.258352 type:complete len:280 (-) Transcript_83194:79-918(-)
MSARVSRMTLPSQRAAPSPQPSVQQNGSSLLSLPAQHPLVSMQALLPRWEVANGGSSSSMEPVSRPLVAGASGQQLPPALCPPLVLHDRDTRLAIPADAVDAAEVGSGPLEFDVLGPLNTPVFRISLQEGEGGRRLGLFVPRLQEGHPWVSVRPVQEDHQEMLQTMLPEGSSSCGKVLAIVGPDGTFYGLIVARRGGSYWAMHRSLAMLVVEGERAHRQLRATAAGDRLVASIAPLEKRLPAGKGVAQQLDLQVQAGVDPLLVLACMLTVILLFRGADG